MKLASYFVGALVLVNTIGCNTRSAPGGGTDKATKFDLAGPAMATSIKRGETQSATIKVERGKDFKQTVALKTEAPTGVTAELGSNSNKASEKGDVNLKITAGDKAALGDQVVYVIGTPESGTDTKLEVKIKVLDHAEATDKSSLSLHGPLLATTVKQGETKTIQLNLKPASVKHEEVKLNVDGSHKGISTEFTSNPIKSNDSGEVGLKVMVDKTAALGEHVIRVTGTPHNGTVTAADVKLNVVAP
jgi:uncharacterized membrane protein